MPVQNIECQLAQGQINRYLAGDSLSEAALSQLEGHINECLECKAALDAKRSTLQSILGQTASAPQTEVPAPAAKSPQKTLIDAIRSRAAEQKVETPKKKAIPTHAVIDDRREPAATKSAYTKPLIYSAGLAIVMIAMSTIMKDPTKMLGDRANKALPGPSVSAPANAPATSTKSDTTKTSPFANNAVGPISTQVVPGPVHIEAIPTPEDRRDNSTSDAQSQVVNMVSKKQEDPETTDEPAAARNQNPPVTAPTEPDKAPAATPLKPKATTQTPPKRTTKPATRRATPRKQPAAKPAPSRGMRIYDANGNPISN